MRGVRRADGQVGQGGTLHSEARLSPASGGHQVQVPLTPSPSRY